METIKYGDIKYFTLLDLQDRLRRSDYDKLDLNSLDKLRHEVRIKLESIQAVAKTNKK